MKKHEYIARRPFASFEPGSDLVQPGDIVEIKSKSVAQEMMDNKLIYPNYKTKEDKQAYKVEKKEKARIEHDAGPMFYVLQGDEVIDRLQKSKAEQLRDKINGVSA